MEGAAMAKPCNCHSVLPDPLGEWEMEFCPLHAAAPELLGALKALACACEGDRCGRLLCKYDDTVSLTLRDMVDAAIAKAEGGKL